MRGRSQLRTPSRLRWKKCNLSHALVGRILDHQNSVSMRARRANDTCLDRVTVSCASATTVSLSQEWGCPGKLGWVNRDELHREAISWLIVMIFAFFGASN